MLLAPRPTVLQRLETLVDLAALRRTARRVSIWIEHHEFVVDLGAGIGSREWIRGAITCFGLCAAAWSLAPDLEPLPGIRAEALPEAQWREAQALHIAPLAYGAGTGRTLPATDLVEPLTEIPDRPRVEASVALGHGDALARTLERAGATAADARTATSLVAAIAPLSTIDPGIRLDMVLGRRPTKQDARPLDKLDFRARLDLAVAIDRAAPGQPLRLRRIDIAVDDTPLRVRGRVGSSLYQSARAAGAPPRAIEAWLRAIGSGHAMGASDTFDMLVEQRRAETGEVEMGHLVYAGLERGGRKIQMVRWVSGGRPQWFEASGAGERRGSMQRPVAGRQTSSFGMRRHPLLGYSRFHKGIDYGAPTGTPIVAAIDGVVTYAGWHGGHGNYVKINHAGGLATGYAHMSRFAVRNGARVRQGQLIGYVGSTGLSTGPHLHYEIYKNGAAINPSGFSFTSRAQLAGAELQRFKAQLGRYLAVAPNAPPRFAHRGGKTDAVATAETRGKDKKSRPARG